MKEIINVFCSDHLNSIPAVEKVKKCFEAKGFEISEVFNENAKLNVCIGGDGTFLHAVHESNFPKIPFIGINTGTLGFFQQIASSDIENFVEEFYNDNYEIEKVRLLECNVRYVKNDKIIFSSKCLNDFVLKSNTSDIIHLDVYIDDNHIETFAGDGLIISTPSGSTAYNLSAGGSVLHPDLRGYQLTPLAPIFSKVYRTMKNPIVIPNTSTLKIIPREDSHKKISFITDGMEKDCENIFYFEIKKSVKKIYKVVFDKNWYWKNMKDKFL